MGKIPSRGSDQFVLRFPAGMRDKIREVAERNGRSMNAEIIARLAETMETDSALANPSEATEALTPLVTTIKDEIATVYERKFETIEHLLTLILSQMAAGSLSETDRNELADALKVNKRRDRGVEGDKE